MRLRASTADGEKRSVVLHLLPQSLNRGAQIYAANLVDALRHDTEQEHLLATLFAGPDGRVKPDCSLGVPSSALRRVLDPRAVLRLRRLIKRLRADLVVAHGGEALKYAVSSGSSGVIYKRTGLSAKEIGRFGRAWLYRFLSGKARIVVGVSHELLEQAHELLRVPRERLIYIPNSRSPERYRPLSVNEEASEPKRILFIGQLEPGKRPELFLEVVQELRTEGYGFAAAMVGDGALREAVARRADELGVELLGVRADIPELIRASAVVLMTSAPGTEGMPGVLIEAGLSGVAVVATRAAGVTDVVEHGVTGWIADSDKASEIAGLVGLLLDDDHLRHRQGAAARQRCLRMFSIEATATEWKRLVSDLVTPSPVASAPRGDLDGDQ